MATEAIPLNVLEDLGTPAPLPQLKISVSRIIWRVSSTTQPQPSAVLTALHSHPDLVDTRRRAASRPPTAGRYEVHRDPGTNREEEALLPAHGVDDCTRRRILCGHPRHDQKTAIQFTDRVLTVLPFHVERVQSGNGGELGSASDGT